MARRWQLRFVGGALDGQTRELPGPDAMGPPAAYCWRTQSDVWEHYVPAGDGLLRYAGRCTDFDHDG